MPGKGQALERRLHRYLWHSGYLVRRDIKVILRRGVEISDLDVFAVRFNDLLHAQKVSMEAKHGEGGFGNILQLRGLADYYGVDVAGIVREAIPREVHRFIRELGMMGITHTHLSELEANAGITDKPYVGSFSDEADKAREAANLSMMANRATKDVYWLMHEAWMLRDPFRRISFTVELHRKLVPLQKQHAGSPLGRALRWTVMENFIVAALSVVEISSQLFDEPKQSRKEFLVGQLLGGEVSKAEKAKVVDIVKEIIEAAQVKIDASAFSLDPPFTEDLNKLVNSMIRNASRCQGFLRYNDYVAYSWILTDKKPDISDARKELGVSEQDATVFSEWNHALLSVLGPDPDVTALLSPIL